MSNSKFHITPPQGSNWVLWYPKVCITTLFERREGKWNASRIRALLLLTAIPFVYLSLSLNWFWCLVIGVAAWYGGVLIIEQGTGLSRFPVNVYAKAILVALFWVCVGRFIWLNYLLIMNAFYWIGNWF